MIKKDQVIPGTKVKVIKDTKKNSFGYYDSFIVNAYALLTDPTSQRQLFNGDEIEILSKPRKLNAINLVKIKMSDGFVGEVFYCDLQSRCELVKGDV